MALGLLSARCIKMETMNWRSHLVHGIIKFTVCCC